MIISMLAQPLPRFAAQFVQHQRPLRKAHTEARDQANRADSADDWRGFDKVHCLTL